MQRQTKNQDKKKPASDSNAVISLVTNANKDLYVNSWNNVVIEEIERKSKEVLCSRDQVAPSSVS